MPTSCSISSARSRALAWPERPCNSVVSCARMVSTICVSTVSAGFSAVRASCMVIAMSRPRIARSSRGESLTRSRPAKRISPAAIQPGGLIRPMTERNVADLPEPDSPTMPRHSPEASSKSTPSTALTTPCRVRNRVFRPWMASRGWTAVLIIAFSDRTHRASPGSPS